jgi:cobalt-zinc-cadmium efflux system outer membrane protein
MPFHARGKLFAALLVVLSAGSIEAQDLTEATLLQRFLSDNPQVRALRAGVEAIRAETRSRTLYPNPTASYSREGAGLAEFFQYEQPLVLTARRRLFGQAAAAAGSAAANEVERSIWELRSDLRTAFYHLLDMQERRSVLEGTVRELAEVVRILERREAAGESSSFDLTRVERELLEADTDLASNQAGLATARGLIAAVVGIEAGLELRAAGSLRLAPPAPPVDTLISRALEVRQDYLALRAQLERNRNEKRAAELLRIPDPIVTVGIKRGEGFPATRHGSVIALTVPLPLFNRGQMEVARSEAEYQRAEGRLDALARRIRAEVTAARSAFELRRSASEQYQKRLGKSGADLVRIGRIAYEEGEKTILELLDVYRLARQTDLRRLELLAAAKEAEIELERAVGAEVFP